MAPQFVDKLGSAVLPGVTKDVFFAFIGALSLPGPESVSPVTGQSTIRWKYVKLVKAAIAFCHAARSSCAMFGKEWSPQIWAFWSGLKCARGHGSREKTPLVLKAIGGGGRYKKVPSLPGGG